MLIFIAIIIIIGLAIWFVRSKEKDRMKDKGYLASIISVTHISGIQGLNDGTNVRLDLYPDKIIIEDKLIIPLNRIKHSAVLRENQLVEKQKSVIGRTVLGGVLLGPLGAIVGGISGVGKKAKRQNNIFLALDYDTKEGSTETAMFMSPHRHILDVFSKKVNEVIGHPSHGATPYEI